jgi:hypothetical protein
MSEKAKTKGRNKQRKKRYEDEPKFEYVVIGLFSRRVIDWLYRQFENVQFMQCKDNPEFCKKTREAISENVRRYLEDLKMLDTEEGE